MISLLRSGFLVVIVSLYFFPIGLTILPPSLNTKNVLALVGIVCFAYDSVKKQNLSISINILGAIAFAILFSFICLYATDYNHTTDYAYATYIVSFFVWLAGAYSVCAAIRFFHGEATFKLITLYLTAVCFGQCIAALLIDRVPFVQILVDTYVRQGQEFFQELDRLYGIGASLDTAGVRFSLVLVMIAALIAKDASIRSHIGKLTVLLVAFFTIVLIGNMMARTTIIGFIAAMGYFALSTGVLSFVIKQRYFNFFLIFSLLIIFGTVLVTYLYQTDENLHHNIRFAFEGFFNFVEKGEWRTDSTDKLNNTMWIWPEDTKTWIIGSGLFDNFVYSTDIGYCRFILYCGLSGFSVFALFFVYNAYVFAKQNSNYSLMFFFFLVITFVVWIKVATDIFVIYALFYCLDGIERKSFSKPLIKKASIPQFA